MSTRRLLLSILCCTFSWGHVVLAQESDAHFSLHGALGPSLTYLAHQSDRGDVRPSATFHTAVYARILSSSLTVGVLSLATITDEVQTRAEVNQTTVEGETDYQSVAFGPTVLADLNEKWQARIALIIGLQTVKFQRLMIEGDDYQAHYKLAYQARGIELATQYKAMLFEYPMTLILSYKYLEGTKVSILGGNHKEVLTLYTEKSKKPLTEQTLALLASWQIF